MAQFPLKINGAEVCTIEDLKKNFNPAELITYRSNFAAWLKGWDYDEEAVKVKSIKQSLTDTEWLSAICKIIGISNQELEASWRNTEKLAPREQKKSVAEEKRKKEQMTQKDQESSTMPTMTKDNITIEILTETVQEMPYCYAWGDASDSFFVINRDGWFFSPAGYNLFKSTDHGQHWEKISYNGDKIFYCNNRWLTSKDEGYIKVSDDLYEWREVPGPSLTGKDRLFFVDSIYIAVNVLKNKCYNIFKSEDLRTWKKIRHYESHYHDIFYKDALFYLLEQRTPNLDFALYKASSFDELCKPAQDRIMQDITGHKIGRFIDGTSEKILLSKTIAASREEMILSGLEEKEPRGFWVTSDFENFISYEGAAVIVENLILCCDKAGFWVSESGKQKTWRKLNLKPPFEVDKLAYQSGSLVMYGCDSEKVCVARIYAKDDIDNNKC